MIHWCECGRLATFRGGLLWWCCTFCRDGEGHTSLCNKKKEKEQRRE